MYEETRTAVCSYLLCFGVPAAQAQEITQEVYLRLYQELRKGQDIDHTRAWVFRVARNEAIRARSREKVFVTGDLDWNMFSQEGVASPERRVLERERMSRIMEALKELSPQQRECLYLRSEGLRYREIAEALGIGLSTVNEYLRRGITRIAEAVGG